MKTVAAIVAASMLSGCAMTPQYYQANRDRVTPNQVCRAWIKASDDNFKRTLRQHAESLGLTYSNCVARVDDEDDDAAAGIGIALLALAAVAVVAAGGGGGGSNYASNEDTRWEWDEFYNEYRQLVWACRGYQTGQFADTDHCDYKPKIDNTWPTKSAKVR